MEYETIPHISILKIICLLVSYFSRKLNTANKTFLYLHLIIII